MTIIDLRVLDKPHRKIHIEQVRYYDKIVTMAKLLRAFLCVSLKTRKKVEI